MSPPLDPRPISPSFSGISNFTLNSGGAITTVDSVMVTFHGTNNFINNSAWFGGAIHADTNSYLNFSGTSNLSHNSAQKGGAIHAEIILIIIIL